MKTRRDWRGTEREVQLTAVLGLHGGSRRIRLLSGKGLGNVQIRDSSDGFTFVLGSRRYRCPSSVAQFLSPRVCHLHWIDATIDELGLEVYDRDELFRSVLEAARGGSIALDSAHRRTFASIFAALWDSELCECVLGGRMAMEKVVNRLQFLSRTRCDVSTELELIASRFYEFSHHPDALNTLSFPLIYERLGHRSLRLESEDCNSELISKVTETNWEFIRLLEFVKFEYCSTDKMKNLLELI
jgi:hypothetical protein